MSNWDSSDEEDEHHHHIEPGEDRFRAHQNLEHDSEQSYNDREEEDDDFLDVEEQHNYLHHPEERHGGQFVEGFEDEHEHEHEGEGAASMDDIESFANKSEDVDEGLSEEAKNDRSGEPVEFHIHAPNGQIDHRNGDERFVTEQGIPRVGSMDYNRNYGQDQREGFSERVLAKFFIYLSCSFVMILIGGFLIAYALTKKYR